METTRTRPSCKTVALVLSPGSAAARAGRGNGRGSRPPIRPRVETEGPERPLPGLEEQHAAVRNTHGSARAGRRGDRAPAIRAWIEELGRRRLEAAILIEGALR